MHARTQQFTIYMSTFIITVDVLDEGTIDYSDGVIGSRILITYFNI